MVKHGTTSANDFYVIFLGISAYIKEEVGLKSLIFLCLFTNYRLRVALFFRVVKKGRGMRRAKTRRKSRGEARQWSDIVWFSRSRAVYNAPYPLPLCTLRLFLMQSSAPLLSSSTLNRLRMYQICSKRENSDDTVFTVKTHIGY